MPNLEEINAMDRAGFTRHLGPLFEHSPWVAERTWPERPFPGEKELHAALCRTVREADAAEQLALIAAHPDLVTKAVLTRESQGEQASAGLGSLTEAEAQAFREYNAAYRARFGFPFIICARLNKKEAILEAFPRRLENSREKEIETALEEIYKIAELRLRDLIG